MTVETPRGETVRTEVAQVLRAAERRCRDRHPERWNDVTRQAATCLDCKDATFKAKRPPVPETPGGDDRVDDLLSCRNDVCRVVSFRRGPLEHHNPGHAGTCPECARTGSATADTPPTPESTTVTEWGVRVVDGKVLYRAAAYRDERDARAGAINLGGLVVSRTRTSYADTVTGWIEADQ